MNQKYEKFISPVIYDDSVSKDNHYYCYALGYDIPNHYEQKYRNGELEMRNTFKNRVLTETPKFVQQKLSTPVKEDETKDFDLSTLVNEALKK